MVNWTIKKLNKLNSFFLYNVDQAEETGDNAYISAVMPLVDGQGRL